MSSGGKIFYFRLGSKVYLMRYVIPECVCMFYEGDKIICFFILGIHPAVLMGYSWLLVVLETIGDAED